jgi:O-antigen/teichoic acid export membrane protein
MTVRRTSLRRNILANSLSQIYVMGIGVVMAPVYLSFMGKEAYGLIGFFTMMGAWFQLLDMGLTPTLARETARFRGGAISVDVLRSHVRAMEILFGAVALAGAAMLVLMSQRIATQWLNVRDLPIEEVARAVMLMGLTVPLRWLSGLYRGIVNGFERQVWLSGYNALIATLRFAGVLIVFVSIGATPVHFFVYQLVVALAELVGLVAATYSLVRRGEPAREKFSWRPLAGNLMFSMTIAVSATIWVVVMQTDKLILSKTLPLAEYGVFSIAVVAAGAINAANAPFNQALLPRLTKLVAERDDAGVAGVYSSATQAVCVVMVPAVAALAFFAGPILRAWTGDMQIAARAAPILSLYAVGNGFVSLNSFAYYIQYAKGDLKLHFIGHALLLLLLVPAYIWAAPRYGAIGTGGAWAVVNGLYTLFWLPVVHARVFRGEHWKWLTGNVLPITIPTILMGALLWAVASWPQGRLATCVVLAICGAVLFVTAAAGSAMVRKDITSFWTVRFARASRDRL